MKKWVTLDEITNKKSISYTNKKYQKAGLVIGYEDNKVIFEDSEAHNLIIGTTGSKKSRLAVMPMVVNSLLCQNNVVVLDVKGEIYKYTKKIAENNGYNIYKIDFLNPANSNQWNPFGILNKTFKEKGLEALIDEIAALSDILYPKENSVHSDPYWKMAAQQLFKGLMLMCFVRYSNRCEITPRLFKLFSEEFVSDPVSHTERFLMKLGAYEPIGAYAKDSEDRYKDGEKILLASRLDNEIKNWLLKDLSIIFNNAVSTARCIFASFNVVFNRIVPNSEISKMLSGEEEDIYNKLLNEKTIIYLVVPDDSGVTDLLVNLFVEQSYNYLSQKTYNKPMKRCMQYILDEFANITSFRYFDRYVSLARGRNIKFTIVLQDIQQIENSYPETYNTILSNINNVVYLYSSNKKTNDYFIERSFDRIEKNTLCSLIKENDEALFVLERNPVLFSNLIDISEFVERVKKNYE